MMFYLGRSTKTSIFHAPYQSNLHIDQLNSLGYAIRRGILLRIERYRKIQRDRHRATLISIDSAKLWLTELSTELRIVTCCYGSPDGK